MAPTTPNTANSSAFSSATGDKRAWLSYYYDDHTRRLHRSIVDAEVDHPMQTDTHYTYNPAGTITSIANTPIGQLADTQCFRHDYLQRLTEAWTPENVPCSTDPSSTALGGPAPYWQSFAYDKSGSRTSDTQHGTGGDTARTYSYSAPGTPKPHLLNSVSSTAAAGGGQYAYDQVGNTKMRPGLTGAQGLDWNLEGRLDTVTEGTAKTSFIYDADGGRLIRRDPAGTTLYLGAQEVRMDKTTGNVTTTRYYSHGDATVAMRSAGVLTWLASDHQGTTQVAINSADPSLVKQQRQTPFGGQRGGDAALPGERGFVGGTRDVSTGLTHLGARDYDADLGRFVSLDPILDPSSPQQINGYNYANNDPVTLSDPSGYKPCGSADDCAQYDQYLQDIGQYYSVSGGEKPQTPAMKQNQAEHQKNKNVHHRVFPGGTEYQRTKDHVFINGIELPITDVAPDFEVLAGQLDNLVSSDSIWKKTAQRQAELGMFRLGSLTDEATLSALQAVCAESCDRRYLLEISSDLIFETFAGEDAGAVAGAAGAAGALSKVGSIWTARKNVTSVENAFGHFGKHGDEFDGIQNSLQYVRKARGWFDNPTSTTLSRTRKNGDVVRFDPATDYFGVMTKDGTPKTFFRPDPAKHGYPTNLDYFNAQ